jgi:hypothetical protein
VNLRYGSFRMRQLSFSQKISEWKLGGICIEIADRIIALSICSLAFILAPHIHSPAPSRAQDSETRAIGVKGTEKATETGSGSLNCYDYARYYVFVHTSLQGEMVKGSDILVRPKTTRRAQILCDYIVKQGDFEVKSELGQGFGGIKNDLLLVDTGIGPNQERYLTLYDLSSRKSLYKTRYLEPIEISQTELSFWRLNGFASTDDCANANDVKSAGLRLTIEERVVLNLQTLHETNVGATRCGVLE